MRVSSGELLAGVALDLVFGNPQWLPHPVRGIGKIASVSEKFWRKVRLSLRFAGAMFWVTVVGIAVGIIRFSLLWANIYWIYSLLACRDLDQQAARVVYALECEGIEEARRKLSWIVGRDTAYLDEQEILRATVETVAENLNDGVVAPLFYLFIAGPLGMAAYKAINTLDSMVGYRNERYREFGWASARVDDLANYVPARLTAPLVWINALLTGLSIRRSIQVTLRDGHKHPSPNAGYPEAAVAGALGVQLGGLNFYEGVPSRKPVLWNSVASLGRDTFRQARKILYLSEAILIAACLGLTRWR